MTKDPYQVLSISRGASDEEVKKAYRAQCKRWHPDLNPNDASAEERFKDIQAAYDAITKGEANGPQAGYGQNPYGYRGYGQQGAYGQSAYGRPNGNGQNAYGGDPFGFDSFFYGPYANQQRQQSQTRSANYESSDTPELQAARTHIANGQYQEARRILNAIQRRNARWYYLSALTHNGLGQSINALQDARMAVQMEPTNNDYRNLLMQLQNPGQTYYRRTANYGTGGAPNLCFRLILLNMFLNCFCGGGCSTCCRMPFGRFYF